MSTGSSDNIFDFASKKKEIPLPKKNPAPSPLKSVVIEVKNMEQASQADIDMMFAKIHDLQKDLDKKTDDLKDAISSSRTEVIDYFNNSKNFTPEQWSVIQNNRTELEQKTWAVVGKDPNIVKEKKLEAKNEKARMAKSLGSRHNWLPMR